MTDINAPRTWDDYEGSTHQWRNVEMRDLVYSELPSGAVEAIRRLVTTDECMGGHIERVQRMDPETVEIVWFDDEGDDPDKRSGSKLSSMAVNAVERVITDYFGDHWRVRRKPDGRRYNNTHRQRVLVRRASHQRFKLRSETETEYKMMLHDRPDGVPEDATLYGDLDGIEAPPARFDFNAGDARDIYVYETGTGTAHLLRDVRAQLVVEDVACECGLTVQPETAVDGLEHYGAYVARETQPSEIPGEPNPMVVFGDDLCERCWESYAQDHQDIHGNVLGKQAPAVDFGVLYGWSQ